MRTKTWPDPDCRGPHKRGQRLIRWQHTQACKDAAAGRFNKDDPENSLPESETIVDRGRAVGAL